RETHAKAQKAYDAGIAAVEATPGLDTKALLTPMRASWDTYLARQRELEQLAPSIKQREMRVLDPWYKAMSDVLDTHAKLSLYLSNAVRMTDPAIAEFVEPRQLGFAPRDTAGRECGTARPFIARSQPFTPQARDTILDLRGRTEAALAQLVDVTARPGIAPQLSRLVGEVRELIAKGKADRDALSQKLDGSGQPLVRADKWTESCAGPMERVYQVAWTSFDLMLAHARRVDAAATW